MTFTVFYSWQSDLPNSTNRGFIQAALGKAAKGASAEIEVEIHPRIDHSTEQIPGSPDISHTIFEKIEKSDCFVADISLVTGNAEGERFSPNPNVLIELGYAVRALGWDRVILVSNDLGRNDEDYPFDLRGRRRMGYSLSVEEEKAPIRTVLVGRLKVAFVEILKARLTGLVVHGGPNLVPHWLQESPSEEDELEQIEVEVLVLKRFKETEFLSTDKLKADRSEAKNIDGSMDSKWGGKLEDFLAANREYLKFLEDPKRRRDWGFFRNAARSATWNIGLYNKGDKPAANASLEIELPDWIIATDEIPEDDFPEAPSVPVPRPARATDSLLGSALGFSSSPGLDFPTLGSRAGMMLMPDLSLSDSKRDFELVRKGRKNVLKLWIQNLLHKHTDHGNGTIYLWAAADTEPGDYELEARVYCEEYSDFVTKKLQVKVE